MEINKKREADKERQTEPEMQQVVSPTVSDEV